MTPESRAHGALWEQQACSSKSYPRAGAALHPSSLLKKSVPSQNDMLLLHRAERLPLSAVTNTVRILQAEGLV
ncbi:hypothetical protein PBY51_009023 [Eleginops maclovinus]|uniref:Uncharacterized protein n=1 Tax=Eleginops maclovinus TaxID=56733 RepID=A0AAN7WVI2_ELEMC|nr:hypothetical protein PBY51_009023 [Eleginops maclovinus]